MSPQRGRRPPGRLRQSQVITTFGPGALVDLPNYSVLIGGLEQWSSARTKSRSTNLVSCIAKLEQLLNVQGLQLQNARLSTDQDPTAPATGITAWRFPKWFHHRCCRDRQGRVGPGFSSTARRHSRLADSSSMTTE